MISKDDVRQIRWPFVASVLMCLAGIVVVVLAESQLDAARMAREQVQQDRTAAQERVTKATDEEREIRQNLVEYEKMVKIGMVGRTNRINLVERMASIKTERKLFEMRYNIDAQKPVDLPASARTITGSGPGAMDFVTNRMQIDMLLLHELDLLNFLNDLQSSNQAFVSVRHCSLARNDRSTTGPTVQPTLKGACTIDLINLIEGQSS